MIIWGRRISKMLKHERMFVIELMKYGVYVLSCVKEKHLDSPPKGKTFNIGNRDTIWNLFVTNENCKSTINSDDIPKQDWGFNTRRNLARESWAQFIENGSAKQYNRHRFYIRYLFGFDLQIQMNWSDGDEATSSLLAPVKHLNTENSWDSSTSLFFKRSWMKPRCCRPKYIACYKIKPPVIPSLKNTIIFNTAIFSFD